MNCAAAAFSRKDNWTDPKPRRLSALSDSPYPTAPSDGAPDPRVALSGLMVMLSNRFAMKSLSKYVA